MKLQWKDPVLNRDYYKGQAVLHARKIAIEEVLDIVGSTTVARDILEHFELEKVPRDATCLYCGKVRSLDCNHDCPPVKIQDGDKLVRTIPGELDPISGNVRILDGERVLSWEDTENPSGGDGSFVWICVAQYYRRHNEGDPDCGRKCKL